jgi:tetratricopeptide (TPR) repeat protein
MTAMKQILALCVMILVPCGARVASAQQAAPAKPKTLDDRSVLMSWTNKPPPAGNVEQIPVASPKPPAPVPVPAAGTNAAPAVPKPARAEQPPPPSPYDDQVEAASKMVRGGQTEEGMKSLLEVLAKEPKHRRARFELGTAYIQLERYREALDLIEPMIVEFPKDYFLKNNLSWLYATAKDPAIRDGAKAVRLAQDALFIAPGDFHVWSTLSEAYYISGDYTKAQRAAEEALRLATQSGMSGRALEEYRRQVTKSEKAAQATSVME